MHNTLAASDYGLLDGDTFEPRPNYWAALLWRRLMGEVVLDPGPGPAPNLHLYAHCLRGVPGGVALLAINLDRAKSQSLPVSAPSQRYTLTARKLTDQRVQMNGSDLASGAHGELPPLAGTTAAPDPISLAPTTITFLAIPQAQNKACR